MEFYYLPLTSLSFNHTIYSIGLYIMKNLNIVKASEVIGVKVQNKAGEHMGEITEVVIDKTQGKINYLVLDFGGVLGFGNKFFAMPWGLFTYNTDKDCFIINIDKERLKNAPGFDKSDWPDFSLPEYISSITEYYQY